MTYHSESITRRFLGFYHALEIKNMQPNVEKTIREKQSKDFENEWERLSRKSNSREDRLSYFTFASMSLDRLIGAAAVLPIPIWLLLDRAGVFLDGFGGLLLLPFMILVSVQSALKLKIANCKKSKGSLPNFSKEELLLSTVIGVVITLVITLLMVTYLFQGTIYR